MLGLGLLASVFLVTRNGASESVQSSAAPAANPAVTPAAPEIGKSGKSGAGGKAEAHGSAAAKDAERDKGSGRKAAARKGKPGASPAGKARAADSVEERVLLAAKALGEDKAVVFFFSKPGAADDVGARVAMKSLRGMDRVSIFDASLDDLAAYRPMLQNVGISQIPSTVIVRPGKKAILLQGFVDAGTLRQNVADALR
jgi:hypothetical protein